MVCCFTTPISNHILGGKGGANSPFVTLGVVGGFTVATVDVPPPESGATYSTYC